MFLKDRKDRKLVELLQKDGRMPLTTLGKELGMSHVGIKKRLEKLSSKGMIRVSALINSKLFVYAIILAEMEDYDSLKEVAKRLGKCPRMLLLAPLIGGANFIAVMAFEDLNVLEACMGSCMVRTLKGIRRSEVMVSRGLMVPKYIYLPVSDPSGIKAPCGIYCPECSLYGEGKCLGCPSTKYYKLKGKN